MTSQPELSFFQVAEDDPNIAFLEKLLAGRDWLTAGDIITEVFQSTQVRWPDRKVRALAAASKGRIAGGQRGYKLTRSMTRDEFQHVVNWMRSQTREMEARVIAMENVFYAEKPNLHEHTT
jgi:hypothetical protein